MTGLSFSGGLESSISRARHSTYARSCGVLASSRAPPGVAPPGVGAVSASPRPARYRLRAGAARYHRRDPYVKVQRRFAGRSDPTAALRNNILFGFDARGACARERASTAAGVADLHSDRSNPATIAGQCGMGRRRDDLGTAALVGREVTRVSRYSTPRSSDAFESRPPIGFPGTDARRVRCAPGLGPSVDCICSRTAAQTDQRARRPRRTLRGRIPRPDPESF